MQGPEVAPENLPSVIRATLSRFLSSMRLAVNASSSGIPGPPLGPSYRIMMMDSLGIFFF